MLDAGCFEDLVLFILFRVNSSEWLVIREFGKFDAHRIAVMMVTGSVRLDR